jgi:hypothetical protein
MTNPKPEKVLLSWEEYQLLLTRANQFLKNQQTDVVNRGLSDANTALKFFINVERESARVARDECFRLRKALATLQRQHDERCRWLRIWQEDCHRARSSWRRESQRRAELEAEVQRLRPVTKSEPADDFCRHCGARIPPIIGEGSCGRCEP